MYHRAPTDIPTKMRCQTLVLVPSPMNIICHKIVLCELRIIKNVVYEIAQEMMRSILLKEKETTK